MTDLLDGLERFETRYGSLAGFAGDMYVSQSLRSYGEWCEGEVDVARLFLGPGAVALDAGANIGTMTLAFARLVGPTGVVIAVEYLPTTARVLSYNCVANGLRQVEVLNVALGDAAGQARAVRVSPTARTNYGALRPGVFDGFGPQPVEIRVPRVTIDEVLHLQRLDYIKLDLEGAEVAALRGGLATIRRFRPAIYMEVSSVDDMEDALDLLSPEGYAFHWHVAFLYRQGNFRGNRRDVFGDVSCLGMLCTPPGRSVPGLPPVERGRPHAKLVAAARRARAGQAAGLDRGGGDIE